MESLFLQDAIDTANDAIVTSARQFAALGEAIDRITDAVAVVNGGMGTDLAASDLERAVAALDELDGRTVCEEVVSEIFSHFCVGK